MPSPLTPEEKRAAAIVAGLFFAAVLAVIAWETGTYLLELIDNGLEGF